MKHTTSLRRFAAPDIDPSKAVALAEDHPAVVGGRTLFPSTVVGSLQSPRFLVSGHNNPKLGKEVTKGERKGWPIYQLTLEERATCPRTCEQWASCYGNAMPFARRHTPDADFLDLLRSEVSTLARQHPNGLLVRLHALGDFYSPEYVLAWAVLLATFPQLHVFGYTARRTDDADPVSARTARAIKVLTEALWPRFAIRTSTSDAAYPGPRSIVVDGAPQQKDVILCPAQTHDTETCGTCGLCWAAPAKTVAFLRHGMTRARGPRQPKPRADVIALPTAQERREVGATDGKMLAAIRTLAGVKGEVTASLGALSEASGIPKGSVIFVVRRLVDAGRLEVVSGATGEGIRRPNTYRIIGEEPQQPKAPKPRPSEHVLWEKIEDGPARPKSGRPLRAADAPPAPAPAPSVPLRVPVEFDEPWLPGDDAPGPKPLLNLRSAQCRWPVGEPDPIQLYCAAACDAGAQYCRHHSEAMFVRKRKGA